MYENFSPQWRRLMYSSEQSQCKRFQHSFVSDHKKNGNAALNFIKFPMSGAAASYGRNLNKRSCCNAEPPKTVPNNFSLPMF